MELFKSSNPVLGENVFNKAAFSASGAEMTVKGVARKTAIFLSILIIGGVISWRMLSAGTMSYPLLIGSAIVAFILALITSFAKKTAAITGLLYAVCEGFFLGAVSGLFEGQFRGIVFQAVMLTIVTFCIVLFLYRARILKATGKFVKIIVTATLAIGAFYLIRFVTGFFTSALNDFFAANSVLNIVLSLVIVVIAALNLVLDFNYIETSAENGTPKYMEWYAAFGLIVTLVWLYIEILNLLSKLRD